MEDDVFTLQIEQSADERVSESEGSLQQNISHLISMLDSPSSETTSPQLEILKGVTAYVDVRSTCENRSKAVASQLRQLGATVVPQFTNRVTHVIFRDGRKSVQKKAEQRGVPLLSALWIEACKKSGQHVPEKEFPANVQEEVDLPLALTRVKKIRSMQPKDFEHEPASMEESIKRRRRKFEKDKLKKDFFVEETERVNQALWLGSCNISIPETPPSMKKLLATLHRKTCGTNQNDTSMEGLSVQESPLTALGPKRLFDYSNPTTVTNSPCSCPGVITDSDVHEAGVKSFPTLKVIPEAKKKYSQTLCSPVAETVNNMTVSQQEGADIPCTTKTLASMESVQLSHCTETVSSAGNNSNQLPVAATSKRKRGKKKLLKLDEKPVEKLLSPALSQSSNLSSLSRPQKAARRHDLINLPAVHGLKLKITKRKANYMCSLPSDDGLNQHSAKKSKSDANCNTFTCDEKEQNVNVTGESHVAHSDKGKHSVMPKKKQISTARRSCMPAVSTQREMSSQNMETQESYSNLRCDQDEGLIGSQIITSPIKLQERLAGNPDAEHDAKDKPHRRKLAKPQKCSVKSIVMFVQKPRSQCSSTCDQLYTTGKKQVDHCLDSKGTHCTLTDTVNELQILHSSNTSSAANSMSDVPGAALCPLSRRSIDDFSLPYHREHKREKVSPSSALNSLKDSEEERDKVNHGPSETADRRKKKLKRHSGSGSDGSKRESRKEIASDTLKAAVTRSLVMTSLHSHEQDIVRNVVQKLGAFYIEQRVSAATTHVVCGNNRRTLNVLLAISTGCWLLSLEWIMRSLEAGHWLDEEPYEQKDYFPAAQTNRLARMGANVLPYKSSLFSDSEVFFVAENTKPEHTDLVDLIRLCGGQITHCARKAHVCIGRRSRQDTVGVSEKWLLDCITSQKQLPFDDYLL